MRRPAIKSAKSCPTRVINAANYRAGEALLLAARFIDSLNRTARESDGVLNPFLYPSNYIGIVTEQKNVTFNSVPISISYPNFFFHFLRESRNGRGKTFYISHTYVETEGNGIPATSESPEIARGTETRRYAVKLPHSRSCKVYSLRRGDYAARHRRRGEG